MSADVLFLRSLPFRLQRFAGVFGVVLSAALVLPVSAAAQEKDYEEWVRQQRQEYEQYLSEQDEAFLKFLKKEWKSVRVDTASASPLDDKPRQVPRVRGEPPAPPAEPPTTDEDPGAVEQEDPTSDPAPSERADEESEEDDVEQLLNDPDGSTAETSQFPDEEIEEAAGELEEEGAEGNPPAGESDPQDPAPDEAAPDRPPSSDNASAPAEAEAAEVNREASLSFFGTTTAVPYGSALLPNLNGAPGTSSIQEFWKTMASGPHGPTLEAVQGHREDLGLSDWGYYRYLQNLSAQLYGEAAANEQTLWTWFMLMKSGYDARVGYRQDQVILLLPVEEQVFDRPQMHVDGQRYYLMADKAGGSLRTYNGQHEEATQPLHLSAQSLPDLTGAAETGTVSFTFQDERYELDVAYNPSVVDYLEDYPNVELQVLFEAGVSSVARRSLAKALGPLVEDRPPRAALNLLLRFAQFATDYKRDRDHFGEERFLFPEETLTADYSDCEDRAVLMAYLTRELLGREVVGLKWPNHVALAVRASSGLTTTKTDRTVTVDEDTYILADPTYIGSSLGMEMPIVEGQDPELISIKE